MTSWPRPHLEVPQNSKWPLCKQNFNQMICYFNGHLQNRRFIEKHKVCLKAKLLRITFFWVFSPPVPCNIILPNICELWLKSAELFLAENKKEAGKQKSGANLSAQALIIGCRIFFFFSFRGEGFGGNVSPFRVRYLISILRPIIRLNFHAKLHKGKKLSLWVKFSSKFAADLSFPLGNYGAFCHFWLQDTLIFFFLSYFW